MSTLLSEAVGALTGGGAHPRWVTGTPPTMVAKSLGSRGTRVEVAMSPSWAAFPLGGLSRRLHTSEPWFPVRRGDRRPW